MSEPHESPAERAARNERGDIEIPPNALIQTRDEFPADDPDVALHPDDVAEAERRRSVGRAARNGSAGASEWDRDRVPPPRAA